MWRLIKWLILLAIVAAIVLMVTGYKIKGKTLQEHMTPILESRVVKEGIKDLRSLVGEGLKAAGDVISEDVTDSERKQLENVLKKEMKEGRPIEGAEGQEALPPKINDQKKKR